MSEKSHVSMEAAICPACGCKHETGNLLLDNRMRASMERETVTGWALCEEHQQMRDDGFIILVAIDHDKSDKRPDGSITPQGAYRLGSIVGVRAKVWSEIFNSDAPPNGLGFCDQKVIELLKQLTPDEEEADDERAE